MSPSNHRSPPIGSSPATQAWSSPVPVPTIVETHTNYTNNSVSLKEFQKMQQENAKLLKEMSEMKEKMRKLCDVQRSSVPQQAQTPVHSSAPPSVDIASIVTAVMIALRQQQPSHAAIPVPLQHGTDEVVALPEAPPVDQTIADMSFGQSRIGYEDE
ncbi:hypothetical protein ACA910_006748 [Epithemia clementina (nom. ined.)]